MSQVMFKERYDRIKDAWETRLWVRLQSLSALQRPLRLTPTQEGGATGSTGESPPAQRGESLSSSRVQVDERSQELCGIDLSKELYTKDKFMEKKLTELKETCRRHRLKVSGSKAELADRLFQFQQEWLKGEDSERSEAAQLDTEQETGVPRDARAVREYSLLNAREKTRLKQLVIDSVCPKCLASPMVFK